MLFIQIRDKNVLIIEISQWYKWLATGTIAWVANRETPIRNKSGELTFRPDGVLVLHDSTSNKIIWSSDLFGATRDPVASLLDRGNLMVINDKDELRNYIWQSFDHPGNTFLPGMKFGRNIERVEVTNFTSWKSVDHPSQGSFMVYVDFNGLLQVFQKKGDTILYRLGSWNSLACTSSPSYNSNPIYTFQHVSNERDNYYIFEMINTPVPTKMTLTPPRAMKRLIWIICRQEWFYYSTPTTDDCVRYALCGVMEVVTFNSPQLACLKGFTPKNPNQPDSSDWTSGCRREIQFDCGVQEGFRKYSFLKLPDTRKSWYSMAVI